MAITSSGIGSGLDIKGLVSQLVAAEGQPKYLRLDRQEAVAQAEISALSSFKGALSDFQAKVSTLNNAESFSNRSVKNTKNELFTVSAASTAELGSYTVEVQALAQSHKLASTAFASSTTAVGSGTLTFSFGTYDSGGNTFTLNPDKVIKTVDIDPSDSSLQAIRDAVNNAEIGVKASIINNGSGEVLVFSSEDTGSANSLKITVDDDDLSDTDNSGLSQLAYDPTATAGSGKNLSQTVAATDATIVVDGISVTSASNSVTSVIEGVTLNLNKAEIGETSTFTIGIDKTGIKAKINLFVTEFNSMIESITNLSSYDADTKRAGILNGDVTVRTAETQIRSIIASSLSNLSGSYQSLADIGISTNADGSLSLDASQLDTVIEDDPSSLSALFAAVGITSDSLVEFESSTDATQEGGYRVNVSQIATQGNLVGSAAANLTITEGSNDTLVFEIDGKTATIAIAAGTYTASELAAQVQAKLNGTKALSDAGLTIGVSESGGVMTITSDSYGSESVVSLTGGNGKDDFIGLAPTQTDGVDVAGTINGVTATGSGQFLTGTGSAAGLKLSILGGATGDRGSVDFARGIAAQLEELLDDYLEADNVLDVRTETLNSRIDSIADQREAIDRRLAAMEARLTAQFTALDALVGQLRSTSDYLTSQLENLPGPRKVNSN